MLGNLVAQAANSHHIKLECSAFGHSRSPNGPPDRPDLPRSARCFEVLRTAGVFRGRPCAAIPRGGPGRACGRICLRSRACVPGPSRLGVTEAASSPPRRDRVGKRVVQPQILVFRLPPDAECALEITGTNSDSDAVGYRVSAVSLTTSRAHSNGPTPGICIIIDASGLSWLSHAPGTRSCPGLSRTGSGRRNRICRSWALTGPPHIPHRVGPHSDPRIPHRVGPALPRSGLLGLAARAGLLPDTS